MMKKFEEEVKRPSNAGIDPFSKRDVSFEKLSSKFTKGAQTLKEWKEYAFKAEDKIRELESQLKKQQPELPEFVAEWIEILKTKGLKPLKNPETYGETGFTEEKLQNIVFWISENQEDYMRAWLDGYTVEKPQLFYLKNKLTDMYLYKKPLGGYGEEPTSSIKYLTDDFKFTQQEIDSMETGSYEVVPVEV
ncbi:DUF1642 domain-containing protein [Lactococcus petauri]